MIAKLEALHAESATALSQPKASRRADLTKELFDLQNALNEKLNKVSTKLANSVKLDDSFVDHLMQIKQLAWMARNDAGNSSLLISNILGGFPVPPDAMSKFVASLSRTEAAWAALTDLSAGLPLPTRFGEAVKKGEPGVLFTRPCDIAHDDFEEVGRQRENRPLPAGMVESSG